MTRVLVLGATGMLGHEVLDAFRTDFETQTTARPGVEVDGVVAHPFDALSDDPDLIFAAARPDVAINCIGLVKQRPEAGDIEAAIRLNALLPHRLAEAAERHGSRLIQISTDCVFSGDLPLGERYGEEWVPDPRDAYGQTKLLGEIAGDGHLTLRTSIIGWELERRSGLLEWFAAQPAGATVSGFRHAIFSGLTTPALSNLLVALVRDHPGLDGLYHVAARPIAKFDLLLALRETLAARVEVVPADEPVVNRALDPTRFHQATGLEAPSWDAMLDDLRR